MGIGRKAELVFELKQNSPPERLGGDFRMVKIFIGGIEVNIFTLYNV